MYDVMQSRPATALERTYAFWCRIPSRANFGDALTPWLIHRLTGKQPSFVWPADPRNKYFVAGSIIRYAGMACTIWGSGVMNRCDLISPKAKLIAVRGPLTHLRAIECGANCQQVFGDPALLLPRFYRPPTTERRGMGIVPHYSDMPRLLAQWQPSSEIHLIDIQDRIELVIDRITSCEFVISSSLHGLIVSHSYGIPAVWIKFRNLPSGDDIKFRDYFLSIGQVPPSRSS